MAPQGSINISLALCSWPDYLGGQNMWQRTSVHVMMDQKADTREYTSKDATLSNLLSLLIFQLLQFPEPPPNTATSQDSTFQNMYFKFKPHYLP